MKITSVTPIKPKVDPKAGIEVSVGEYDDVTSDWYQADITSLQEEFDRAEIDYLEYTLMRKSVGAVDGQLVSLVVAGGTAAFLLLKAWLPARQGRKVRIKFKDGSEIEATTVKELEKIHDKFLAHKPEEDADEE